MAIIPFLNQSLQKIGFPPISISLLLNRIILCLVFDNNHSGAPAAPRAAQAEPHTHMVKKRKAMNGFSHGFHG